jgi:serine/threonine-protein phosphatase 2A regulatory subunit A
VDYSELVADCQGRIYGYELVSFFVCFSCLLIFLCTSSDAFANRNVRNNLAKCFSEVVSSLGINGERRFNAEQSLVMTCFVTLLSDAESEVRAAAVTHLARMIAWGGQAHFQTHLQHLLPTLADDVVMDVRSKCALALMDAAHGGTLEDDIILQSFGPLLESFLSDEFHEVQLQVLTNLHKISRLLPGLTGVVGALLQMSKATNWRVREAIARLLPHLAEARGLEFFSTVLFESAWQVLLMDNVASVRQAVVRGMGLLVRVAGQDWIVSTLLPRTTGIYNQYSNSYLVRSTILQIHIEIAVEAKSGPAWHEAVAQVTRGLTDKVPNVRMVAARGMGRIVVDGDEDFVQNEIIPSLKKCVEGETDEDCRNACTNALEAIAI